SSKTKCDVRRYPTRVSQKDHPRPKLPVPPRITHTPNQGDTPCNPHAALDRSIHVSQGVRRRRVRSFDLRHGLAYSQTVAPPAPPAIGYPFTVVYRLTVSGVSFATLPAAILSKPLPSSPIGSGGTMSTTF